MAGYKKNSSDLKIERRVKQYCDTTGLSVQQLYEKAGAEKKVDSRTITAHFNAYSLAVRDGLPIDPPNYVRNHINKARKAKRRSQFSGQMISMADAA